MAITIIILVISAIFFMSGKVRSDIVALGALISLILLGILTPEEALSGFSNSVIIMMVGLFVVGGAIFQTGLAKMISSRILKLAGNSEQKLLLLIILVTSGIGAFISNTGTVALMMPIIVSMAVGTNINVSRLLMPLAFASSMGGMMTLIGTPPNLVINNTLTDAGYDSLTFFSFTPVGIVSVLTGIIVLMPLSKRFLTKKQSKMGAKSTNKSQQELAGEYRLFDKIWRVRVSEASACAGKNIQEAGVSEYNITILEIRRKNTARGLFKTPHSSEKADANAVIQADDILYILGDEQGVEKFVAEAGVETIDERGDGDNRHTLSTEDLDLQNMGIAEILLMPDSRLINQAVRESGFRQKFGVNILGIQRQREYIFADLKNEKMHSGDVLLVQGAWDDIARLSNDQTDLVVLGQPLAEAAKVTLNHKAPLAALIMVAMVVSMMFDFIPVAPVTAVMVAALLMVLTGCLRNVEAAYKTINWESIVLIAAMLPMSLALEKTGASAYVSNSLVQGLGEYGPYALLAGIYFTTSLMTMFISNTATAVLLAPIAMTAATQLGLSPYPYLFAVTVAASMCFASPFSTPPNALVMSAGRYTFMDYVKVGLPLQLIMGIVMIFVLPLLFPFYTT